MNASETETEAASGRTAGTVWKILAAASICHLLNDLMQSLLPAVYPILKSSYRLDFGQLGLLTFTNQFTASLLQPAIGYFTDRKPMPYSLPVGMTFTLAGMVLLAYSGSFHLLLAAAGMIGIGSAVFHPESSRVARLASGGQHGMAQSVFQVGGNAGSSMGPLLAAFVVAPRGQTSIIWFSIAAFLGIAILINVGHWYKAHLAERAKSPVTGASNEPALSSKRVGGALAILIVLIFSKYFYLVSLTNYFTFYLIHKFGLSVQSAQIHLFVFLGAIAIGTIVGGPVGDRIGRKLVIWISILGVLPFTLLLPYANLFWTGVLVVPIGMILASAFSAIVVYAQELLPGRVGMISGLFFGFAFGMAGIGAAVLGQLADRTSIEFVYRVCAYLPLLGLLTGLLPEVDPKRIRGAKP